LIFNTRAGVGRTDIAEYRALRRLCGVLLFHDSSKGSEIMGDPGLLDLVPVHKRLSNCRPGAGVPIGNLTSQFFGNVYLDALDQFVKHELRVKYYIRYVDDLLLLDEDRSRLEDLYGSIREYLRVRLKLELNNSRTRLKPIGCGIDFLGYVVHPDHRLVRRRVVGNLRARLEKYETRLVRTVEHIAGSAEGPSSRPAKKLAVLKYPPAMLERLLAVLNSYLSHFAKADTGMLVKVLWHRYSWLSNYFLLEGNKVARRYLPPREFRLLSHQYNWFQKLCADGLLLFQIGSHFELLDGQAARFGSKLGLRTIAKRPGFNRRCGFYRGYLANYLGFSAGILETRKENLFFRRKEMPPALSAALPITVVLQSGASSGNRIVAQRRIAFKVFPYEDIFKEASR